MKLKITALCFLSLAISKADQEIVTGGLSDVGLASIELFTDHLGTEFIVAPPEFPREIEQLLRKIPKPDSIYRLVAVYVPANGKTRAQLLGFAVKKKGESKIRFFHFGRRDMMLD